MVASGCVLLGISLAFFECFWIYKFVSFKSTALVGSFISSLQYSWCKIIVKIPFGSLCNLTLREVIKLKKWPKEIQAGRMNSPLNRVFPSKIAAWDVKWLLIGKMKKILVFLFWLFVLKSGCYAVALRMISFGYDYHWANQKTQFDNEVHSCCHF